MSGAPEVPSVDGADIRSATDMEADNAQKVGRLASLGFPEELMNAVAIQIRVEAIASIFPSNLREEMERRYETMLGQTLDEMYAELTKRKLQLPT